MTSVDLIRRNAIISRDGKVGGVLSPPTPDVTEALQEALIPLLKEAWLHNVMLGLGVLQLPDGEPMLAFAIDVGGPKDKHRFIARFTSILQEYGIQPLEEDLDQETILEIVTHLIETRGKQHQRADMYEAAARRLQAYADDAHPCDHMPRCGAP